MEIRTHYWTEDQSSEAQKIAYLSSSDIKLYTRTNMVQMIYRNVVYVVKMSNAKRYDILCCLVVETDQEMKNSM